MQGMCATREKKGERERERERCGLPLSTLTRTDTHTRAPPPPPPHHHHPTTPPRQPVSTNEEYGRRKEAERGPQGQQGSQEEGWRKPVSPKCQHSVALLRPKHVTPARLLCCTGRGCRQHLTMNSVITLMTPHHTGRDCRQVAAPNHGLCHHADDVTPHRAGLPAAANREPCHHTDSVTSHRRGWGGWQPYRTDAVVRMDRAAAPVVCRTGGSGVGAD